MPEPPFTRRLLAAAGLIATTLAAVFPALAQSPGTIKDEPIGRSTFIRNCAACHGPEGRGDGPMADYLTRKPTTLTTIRERNKGVFPLEYMVRVIDGREMIPMHGTREMPVWGDVFLAQSIQDFWPRGSEQVVRGRILEVIFYVQSIQGK